MNIDKFPLHTKEICILTHAHTDHSIIPKRCQAIIYCSPITKKLMESFDQHHEFSGTLIPNTWQKIKSIDVYIFSSYHSIGSIGLFIPSLCLLHWGDGRPEKKMIQHLQNIMTPICSNLTIHHDDYLTSTFQKKVPDELPSIFESNHLINSVIEQYINDKKIWIRIPHFGALEVLPKKYHYKFKKCGIQVADSVCQEAFHLLNLDSIKTGPKIYVSRDIADKCNRNNHNEDYLFIYLSTNWWFLEGQNQNLYKPFQINEYKIRIFVTNHASPNENKLLDLLK